MSEEEVRDLAHPGPLLGGNGEAMVLPVLTEYRINHCRCSLDWMLKLGG